MASMLVTRQLKKVGARLRALREELRVIDEQRIQLVDEADDLDVRAVVADSPMARSEARDAKDHAAAMNRHRAHVVDEIARLEARQDALLDRLTAG